MGVAAGDANLPNALRIPDWRETNDIKNKYGKVNLASSVVYSTWLGIKEKPGAIKSTTNGIAKSIKNIKKRRIQIRTDKTLEIFNNRRADLSGMKFQSLVESENLHRQSKKKKQENRKACFKAI